MINFEMIFLMIGIFLISAICTTIYILYISNINQQDNEDESNNINEKE